MGEIKYIAKENMRNHAAHICLDCDHGKIPHGAIIYVYEKAQIIGWFLFLNNFWYGNYVEFEVLKNENRKRVIADLVESTNDLVKEQIKTLKGNF